MNRCRRSAGGYTIIEVVIVLTVSALLFAASVLGYAAQNRRTQFTDSVNNFAQAIQDVLNDVQSGFYPSDNSFTCTANASGGYPSVNTSPPTGAQQGTNTDCTFVGKAIQFAPSSGGGTRSNIDIFTLVGRRLVGGTDDPAINMTDARPVILNDLSQRQGLISGLNIKSVRTGGGTALMGIATVSTSNSAGITTGVNNRASLAVIPGSLSQTTNTFNNNIKNYLSGLGGIDPIAAADAGINICVAEGGTGGRTAIIQLAPGESQTIVNIKIDQPC